MRRTAAQLPLFPEPDPAGRAADFDIRESARARHLSIKVYPRGRVEVVVPRRTRPCEVESFVRENRAWIERARESFGPRHASEPFALPSSVKLRALGLTVAVRYVRRASVKSVRFRANRYQVTLRGRTDDAELCVRALKRWLASVARREFDKRLTALSRLTGMTYDKLHIRAQRTCWGSRSGGGTLSLNLCLLFLEPELVRYLIIHELCHGRHMNHSRRFWRLVAKYEPNYRVLDRTLTECWDRVPAWLGIY